MRLGGRRFLLSLAIIGAAVCLALGISLPIIRLTKYVFWTTEHSLLSTVQVLIEDGQTFLGGTVLIFSIVLPVLKLLYLLLVSTLPAVEITRQQRRLKALEWLGKWSMHDVLVLSLTIFFIKAQGFYDAASLSGVYFFTAAVVLMILSYAWLRTEGLAAMREPMTQTAMTRPLSPFRNFVLSFLIILATVFFALGIILPVIRFTTIYVWTNEHSIATIIWALFENEEYFLTVVLFLFSIFFPFLKLFYLLTLVTSPDIPPEFRKKSISTMEWLGRYSMTDVMVLALMIFYVNSSGYTEATVLPGVYFFAASAIITMLAYGWANSVPAARRAQTAPVAEPPPPSPPAPKATQEDDTSHIVSLPTNPGRRHRPA
ncbi:paraquat-inducible protein A [Hyphomicrobium sp. DMF-1]|uniref:paraquat-inducible protein A n=1 Tax=Hyphomicrobium sp. DMF-1 TaxID=3019544 RepID=UPI0022EBE7AB|nr:paraquat-inducible protein A [Hyphomicrobium sp. DMF-1]WBT36579.1 paraquat-inducible protein A [Hyphomicrobium sp. DMF-1]